MRHVGEAPGGANAEDDAGASRPFGSGRHRFESPLQMAGNHRDVSARNEHADSMSEGAHLPIARTGPLGEENIAAGFGDKTMTQGVDRVAAAIFPPHGQGIQRAGGESSHRRRFEEGVTGRERQNAIPQSKRQGGRKDQDIKMTGVVGHHDEGSRRRKMRSSKNLDVLSQPEDSAHPPPPKSSADKAEKSTFASD